MIILLDASPAKIQSYRERYGERICQLRTPLTRYRYANVPFGIDNGAFSGFKRRAFESLVSECRGNPDLLWVACPDVVGSARRTLEAFRYWRGELCGLPLALVAQDGIEDLEIPWWDIEALFVGGRDRFKDSQAALDVCRCARLMGKWVHVGRVNTSQRVRHFSGECDSIDGSGISRFDHMLEDVIRGTEPANQIEIRWQEATP